MSPDWLLRMSSCGNGDNRPLRIGLGVSARIASGMKPSDFGRSVFGDDPFCPSLLEFGVVLSSSVLPCEVSSTSAAVAARPRDMMSEFVSKRR